MDDFEDDTRRRVFDILHMNGWFQHCGDCKGIVPTCGGLRCHGQLRKCPANYEFSNYTYCFTCDVYLCGACYLYYEPMNPNYGHPVKHECEEVIPRFHKLIVKGRTCYGDLEWFMGRRREEELMRTSRLRAEPRTSL